MFFIQWPSFLLLVALPGFEGEAWPQSNVNAPARRELWPLGHIILGTGDAGLHQAATKVFDEIERKTFVKFIQGDQQGIHQYKHAGIYLQTKQIVSDEGRRLSSSGEAVPIPHVELCCFNPAAPDLARQIVLALLPAIGVVVPVSTSHRSPAVLLTTEEADAVNAAYGPVVLPRTTALPARVDVGMWQLAHGYDGADWSDMLGGRGRRVVEGAMHIAMNVLISRGIVGALPTFVFKGNKAEIVAFGPESAEIVQSEALPSEGLGAGIKRASLHARGLADRHLVGGVPTYLGDGSMMLIRAAFAEVGQLTDPGESVEEILHEHHSAMTLASASRWAQSHGALMGIPTFVAQRSVPDERQEGGAVPRSLREPREPLEVLLIHGIGWTPGLWRPKPAAIAAPPKDIVDYSRVDDGSEEAEWSFLGLAGIIGATGAVFGSGASALRHVLKERSLFESNSLAELWHSRTFESKRELREEPTVILEDSDLDFANVSGGSLVVGNFSIT